MRYEIKVKGDGMKIIVPMAGKNDEFKQDDMPEVKHLIAIDGKTMIEHICSMFPKDSEFIFLCRKEYTKDSGLEEHLKNIAKNPTIITLETDTRGPLETALLAEGFLDDDEEIIICHADAFSQWDFNLFMNKIRERQTDGALSTYIGFHPTYLNKTLYASIFVNDNDFVTGVKEKDMISGGFIKNYTSAGSYYFSSWKLFKEYAKKCIEKKSSFNGIFYISLIYNEMIKDGLKVIPFEVKNLIYWGEPKNLKEYLFWSEYFAYLTKPEKGRNVYDMASLIPAAGRGKRFIDAGYTIPKPMIDVLGDPMIVKCARSLPKTSDYVFVCLKNHIEKYDMDYALKKNFPNCEIISIDNYTDGMARTCLLSENYLDMEKPVIVSSCDYSFIYDDEEFKKLIREDDPDVIIWTFRTYPDARIAPNAYAYVVLDGNRIVKISEKIPISDEPHKDHIVQGVFYFKKSELLIECIKEMIEKKIMVGGEYFVGTAINQLIERGKKVVPFEIDKYICLGTPEDLMVFNFWESYFNDNIEHPYKSGKDDLPF